MFNTKFDADNWKVGDKDHLDFDAELLNLIRHIRDLELEATDHFLMEDYPISSGKKTEMKTYRQELRDIPDNGPFDITEEQKIDLSFWPTVPEL
jgi:hypothetical protein